MAPEIITPTGIGVIKTFVGQDGNVHTSIVVVDDEGRDRTEL